MCVRVVFSITKWFPLIRRCTHAHALLVLVAVLAEGCGPSPTAPTPVPATARAADHLPQPVSGVRRQSDGGNDVADADTSADVGRIAGVLPLQIPTVDGRTLRSTRPSTWRTPANRQKGSRRHAALSGRRACVFAGGCCAAPRRQRRGFFGLGSVSRVAGYVNTMARDARFAGAEVVLCTLPPNRPGGFRAIDPP